MIHLKHNGQGFIASATLECVGAMLAHHRASTPVTPVAKAPTKPMPPVTVRGCSLPFEETLVQYWLATRRRVKRSLFV